MVPKSADTKKLILQAFHDDPMAGHYDVTKILKAVKSRFYWPNADAEVCDDICNCPSCQVQTTHLLSQLIYCSTLMCHRMLGTLSLLNTSLVCLRAIAVFVDKLTIMYVRYLAMRNLMLLIGPTCMLSMWFSMRDFLLSSYLIEVLNSSVLSVRPYYSAWESLGICLPRAILKLVCNFSECVHALREWLYQASASSC